jgi:hypothetical protein
MGLGMLIVLPSMILVVLAVLAVPALAAIWLARGASPLAGRPVFVPSALAATAACPSCHRSLRPEWQLCAHCGQRLT